MQKEERPMSQLRLAFVNWKLESNSSKRMKPSSGKSVLTSPASLPSLAKKALQLQHTKPGAAAVIEKLIDDVLGNRIE